MHARATAAARARGMHACARAARAPRATARRARPQRRLITSSSARSNADGAEDDDDLKGVHLTPDQARIAAAALEVVFASPSVRARADARTDAEEVRRRRFELLVREAVERAQASCASDGKESTACLTAWEEVSEVRDAASRAGASGMAPNEGGGMFGNTDAKATRTPRGEEDEAERLRKAKAMREQLAKDPLMGSLPCQGVGECTVAEGTLEARGRLMKAFDEDGDASSNRASASADAVEDAVRRAMALCASGASREDCAVAWAEVEELSNWGSSNRTDWD
jgi:hypothetical protein